MNEFSHSSDESTIVEGTGEGGGSIGAGWVRAASSWPPSITRTCFPHIFASLASPAAILLAMLAASSRSGPWTISWPSLIVTVLFPRLCIPRMFCLPAATSEGVAGIWMGGTSGWDWMGVAWVFCLRLLLLLPVRLILLLLFLHPPLLLKESIIFVKNQTRSEKVSKTKFPDKI